MRRDAFSATISPSTRCVRFCHGLPSTFVRMRRTTAGKRLISMPILDTLNKLLGDPNEKELKRLRPLVTDVRVRGQKDDIQSMQLSDLPAKTQEFRDRAQAEVIAGK